jgi:hypothetical protein
LLERDLGDRFFYCSACCQLHHFSPSWTPTQDAYTVEGTMKCNRFYRHEAFNPNQIYCSYKLYAPRTGFEILWSLVCINGLTGIIFWRVSS